MEFIKFEKVEFTLLETTAKRIDEVCSELGIQKHEFVDKLISNSMSIDPLCALQKIVENAELQTYLLSSEDKCKVYKLINSYVQGKLNDLK